MNTEVIVVGGGLNGLTAAALLAHHGVRCVVIERHASTSIQYKFAGISPRSKEVFRTLGLEYESRSTFPRAQPDHSQLDLRRDARPLWKSLGKV